MMSVHIKQRNSRNAVKVGTNASSNGFIYSNTAFRDKSTKRNVILKLARLLNFNPDENTHLVFYRSKMLVCLLITAKQNNAEKR